LVDALSCGQGLFDLLSDPPLDFSLFFLQLLGIAVGGERGVGLELGAIQGENSQFDHSSFLADSQDFQEEGIQTRNVLLARGTLWVGR
jgi:hypothetical protein